MCGICGIIKKTEITETDKNMVGEMNNRLIHRGPNSAGFFSDEHISIAMRRLSIIDISGGTQPLFNKDKTIALIVNGEIYNYVELREELEKKGCVFITKSDSETIIHAYEEYGDRFINHLRGMFAFCLYDTKKNKVFLCRDRLGEKPLYLYQTENVIAFSSEMKSLLALVPKERRMLNKDAFYTYFHYQYIPDPLTVFTEIKKLPPATILEINLSDFSCNEKKYWTMNEEKQNKEKPIELIEKLLNDIEKIIIRSDVPIGVSLSGGIDSSIIAILSARYSQNKLHAFSVGYAGRPENDERLYAKNLAEKLNMQFHDIEIDKNDFVKDFDAMIFALDDPIADIAGYSYWSVAKKAREEKIPVLLAGFGGDELFWGYEWVRKSVLYNKLKKTFLGKIILFGKLLLINKKATLENPFTTFINSFKKSFNAHYLFYDLTPGFDYVAKNSKNIFTSQFLQKIDTYNPHSFFTNTSLKNPEMDAVILLENYWMLSNCIPLGDRLSMAHSIEMRLPLLDYQLVQSVLALRKVYKNDYMLAPKKWLTDAMRNTIPKDVLLRKKRGFTPPTSLWITEIVQNNRERILDGYLIKNNILNKNFIEDTLKNIAVNQDFLYKTLVMETWLTHYVNL